MGLAYLGVALSGCGRVTSEPLPAAAAPAVFAPLPAALEHDFGPLRTGSRARHEFAIANRTGKRWSVVEVETTCACTVPSISAESVDPSETLKVEVEYKAPAESANDVRAVTVRLRDPQRRGPANQDPSIRLPQNG